MALSRADGKRPPFASTGANEGIRSKAGVRETVAGMKGWRPSAAKARNRFGLFPKRAYSCRTSDRSACLSPRLLGLWSVNVGFPLSLDEAPRPTGRTETAPALHLLIRRRNRTRRQKDQGTTQSEHAAPALRWRSNAGIRGENENAVGVVTGANSRARNCTTQNAAIARLSRLKRLRERRPCEICAAALLPGNLPRLLGVGVSP